MLRFLRAVFALDDDARARPTARHLAPGGARRNQFIAGALLLVLAFRALYLVRFGWCPNWMGFSHLGQAKALALGQALSIEEPLLTPLLLWGARALGLGSTAAIATVYLVAHALFAAGTLGLADFVWPDASRRRRWVGVALLAVLPLLSGGWGHANVAPLLGASLAVCALVLAAWAAQHARAWVPLSIAALLALLATTARHEALLTGLAGGSVLWFAGPRMAGLLRPRRAAVALVLGTALGVGVLAALRALLITENGSPVYAFYTFYDGLPFLMWPDVPDDIDEYGRYLASMQYFGSYAEHGGSVVHAVLTHPGAAMLRLVARLPELLGTMSWLECLTPLGIIAAALGLRGLRREGDTRTAVARGWLLVAYVGPLALLFVPTPSPPYLLCIAAPLLLAMARGIDRVLARASPTAAQRVGVAALLCGILYVAFLGRLEVASSRVIAPTAGYLEARCARGCLTNILPQALRVAVWADLEAGSPLPKKQGRTEAFILGSYPQGYRRAHRFTERVRAARAAGYSGPVLYVKAEVASSPVFHPVFDPEHGFEGHVDLRGATLEREFVEGPDRIAIYAIR